MTKSLTTGFIGYWVAPWCAIVMTEHFVFRRMRWDTYDPQKAWNEPNLLPPGYAAVVTFIVTIGLIVPCMDQEWYTGPIAAAGTGDIGMLVGLPFATVLYSVLRWLEKQRWGR